MGRPGSELIQRLREHGLSEKGARLYLAATREGPLAASELARIASLHRVDAYRVIQELAAAGLLRPSEGRPMRFSALPPGELLDQWIRTATDHANQLREGRDRILSGWQSSLQEVDESDPRRFTVLEGRESIGRFLAKRVGAARRQIRICGSAAALDFLMDTGIDRALREASDRGVRVRVVTDVDPAHLPQAKHFAGFTELRHSEAAVTQRAFLIDRSGTLLFLASEEGIGAPGESVAIWSSSPAFLDLARVYHQRLWQPSVKAEQRVVELEVPETATLPVTIGRRERELFLRLKEMKDLGMRATGVRHLELPLPDLIRIIGKELGVKMAEHLEGSTPNEVARSLSRYYSEYAPGRLELVKERPTTLRVSGCFACTNGLPEIGRMMCPRILRSALETRLGGRWEVSAPDPRRHATRGCLFVVRGS